MNPGLPVLSNFINYDDFYTFLNNQSQGEANKKPLLENNFIWVLGNNEPFDFKQEKWINFFYN